MGAQWISDRVLELSPRGCRFEPYQDHCVVTLSKTLLFLLSTGSTKEDLLLMSTAMHLRLLLKQTP